ncbi:MAG: aminotransferase class V-fold PLP-dependent enzyme [Bacteroidetes bacterium]|nr:aminotransferase class V-fold PLP-dependent enzyme [Bacteroidota bacterium]
MINYSNLFLLDPEITFLNFGSFGACPKPIFEKYQEWQLKLEREPVQFIVNEALVELENVRKELGLFLGCCHKDLVMVMNPSYAINTIAKSFSLKEDDEILTTNLEYGACDRTWTYYCEKAKAKYVRQQISLPIQSKDVFLEEFWKGYSDKTRAIFISQITSATGLILPVKEICDEAKKRGLLTIVDGAHVPGHIELNLSELQADIYTGACHKWLMGPKGSSFLYVNKENQHWVDPLLISWGFQSDFPSDSTFIDYHQTAGTRDYAAFLTVTECLKFREKFQWNEVSQNCRKMALENGLRFCELVGSEPLAPLNEDFYGQLFSIPIIVENPQEFQKKLFNDYKIEIPVAVQNGSSYLRYSVQAFNTQNELDYLYDSLVDLKKKGYLLSSGK